MNNKITKKFQIECCVENFDQALYASHKNVEYIELCDNLAVGGTTPSYGVLKIVKKYIFTPTTVLIRPRSGNFIYTSEEIEIINNDIIACKNLRYNSIRVGALTSKNKLDEHLLTLWKDLAHPMDVSCHMAFDEISNYYEGLDLLIKLGFNSVLTKGHPTLKAPNNTKTLKKMIQYANNNISIIIGSGITHKNVFSIFEETHASILHGTQIIP